MPIEPTVFQPIRSNDVQHRPIKAYKNYALRNASATTESGHFIHNGVYKKVTPHIDPITGQGVGTRVYPVNAGDSTNEHVVWNTIDARYYRKPTPDSSFDFTDIEKQHNFLSYSASILTMPYFQVGEKIKPFSGHLTTEGSPSEYDLFDDGEGNLRDPKILTSSFASESKCFLHISFNDLYRKYNDYEEAISGRAMSPNTINYELNHVKKQAKVHGTAFAAEGIEVTSSVAREASGMSFKMTGSGLSVLSGGDSPSIEIPHDDKFNRFGKCDDWTISFWHKTNTTSPHTIMSKWGRRKENFLDSVDGKRKTRFVESPVTTGSNVASNYCLKSVEDFETEGIRTPFHIICNPMSTVMKYTFFACDGKRAMSVDTGLHVTHLVGTWCHVLVRNSGSKVNMYIDGKSGYSQTQDGVIPDMTINSAQVMIGNTQTIRNDGTPNDSSKTHQLAEIRMYDYAVPDSQTASLSDRNYMSASCYQTNVAGNIHYKNAQVVVSSPLPKYHSGSGAFKENFLFKYKGTHTIYENEVLVRVPKDTFNVTMNPTATYRPATVGEICNTNHQNVPPGELRKPLFVSGTLKPYITTIGLYNDKAQMLATAKLSTPVQKLSDVDTNFIVRWDY